MLMAGTSDPCQPTEMRLTPVDVLNELREPERLRAVHVSSLTRERSGDSFADVMALVARLLRAPIACVTVLDDEYQYIVRCAQRGIKLKTSSANPGRAHVLCTCDCHEGACRR